MIKDPSPQVTAPKKLFIVDTMAMAFRNYHAFGARPLSTSAGLPSSAIFGSAQFIVRLIESEKPDFLIAATDSKGPTFRHEIYSDYKANRGEMPEDLAEQIPHIFRFFETLDIPLLGQPGMEADDLIGSVVTQFAGENLACYIVSGDKDFMQLIDDRIFLYAPKKGGVVQVVDAEGVRAKFGCRPDQVIDLLAIVGDSSDNVPGVRGIGEKGAAQLIERYESLDSIYENLEAVTNKRQKNALESNRDSAYLSQELVTIKTDIDLPIKLSELRFDASRALANQKLLDFVKEMEFRGLVNKVEALVAGAQDTAPEPAAGAKEEAKAETAVEANSDTKAEEAPQPAPPLEPGKPRNPTFAAQGVTYNLVDTREALESLGKKLVGARKFAFDTETTGLSCVADHPIGVSFAYEAGSAYFVPLMEKDLKGLSPAEATAILSRIFAESTAEKFAHNLKYDLQMLTNVGIKPSGPFGDTMIAAFILNPSDRFGIDYCSEKFLGITKTPTSELIGKKAEISMTEVPIDALTDYACEDSLCCYLLAEKLTTDLDTDGLTNVYREIDVPLIPVLGKMEQTGVFIDRDELGRISKHLAKTAEELEAKIFELAGEEFNINSTKQLQHILYEKLKIHEQLKITRIKKTKTGLSTDVSVLERLSEHPLPRYILEFRQAVKLKNTYVDALPQLIEEKTKRVHTSFQQTGAQTGRLSSSHPNLQNIPIRSEAGREVRRAFCAGEEGWLIVSADYSQIELRLLAHLSKDENLAAAFASGEDIHRSTAATMFGLNVKDVGDADRSAAKAINYGLIYGMGPARLARTTGVSQTEAKAFIEKYFASFPKIRTYIDSSIELARERGHSTTMTGRRRYIEGLDNSGGLTAVNAQNIAVNSPIQGSSADLIKLAMVKIQRDLDQSQLQARMLLQVHDELVFECPQEELDALSEIVRRGMETAMDLDVPLVVDIGHGKTWLEAH